MSDHSRPTANGRKQAASTKALRLALKRAADAAMQSEDPVAAANTLLAGLRAEFVYRFDLLRSRQRQPVLIDLDLLRPAQGTEQPLIERSESTNDEDLRRQIVRGIRALVQENRRLRRLLRAEKRLARTDPLTGLLNRQAIEGIAVAEVQRRGRQAAPLTLGMIDIDEFKAEVRAAVVTDNGNPIRLTASVGLAVADAREIVDYELLYHAASAALREAKERGGNSYVIRLLQGSKAFPALLQP